MPKDMNFLYYMLLSLRTRHSCRAFDPEYEISDENLQLMIRAIDAGPSAGGIRPYAIYHTKDEGDKREIYDACLQQGMVMDCSVVFVICSIPEKSKEKYGDRGELYAIQDTTIAGMCMNFVANVLQLDTCWIGSIFEDEIRKVFKIPNDQVPLSLICVGKELC